MAELGLASRWGIVTAIAFRILMDFSGYSDIAIGLARMLGIRLPENFEIEAAFPRGVRGRILIVISSPNPWHLDRLSESDRVRYRLLEEGTIRRWRAKGYEATDAGRGFVPEDYLDLQHFTESGGEKLAASLAPQIEAIANRPKASEAND